MSGLRLFPWIVTPVAVALLATPAPGEDWPQFRGPSRDGISSETGLARSWGEGGPPVLWSAEVEQGYSGAAIVDGRAYFNDYDSTTSEWLVRAVGLRDGAELWTFREKRRIRPNHAISRTVPATDGTHVFAFDPKAVLHALDAETGRELWRKNLVQEYGTKIPPWYNGQCPLVEEDRVVVAPGGSAFLVAFEKATGEEIWRTDNPEGWPMSHASVMPATLGGVDQYLYNTLFGTHGVAKSDGELLWHHPFKFNVAIAPSPLPIDGDHVFTTSGYDAGGGLFRVVKSDDRFTTEQVFVHPPDEWSSEVQTPILYDGHLFAVDKKKRGQLTCLDLDGKVVWSTGGEVSFDLGNFIIADGLLFILDGRSGTLHLLEASTTEYRELDRASVLSGHDVWTPMALSEGVLVVRDLTRVVALDVSAGAGSEAGAAP